MGLKVAVAGGNGDVSSVASEPARLERRLSRAYDLLHEQARQRALRVINRGHYMQQYQQSMITSDSMFGIENLFLHLLCFGTM